MTRAEVLVGDSREQLRTLADASVDAVVTDPPYEIGFMGRGWDASGIAYDVGLWREVLRVLKPGGHLLAFGATRTYHRLAVAIEDAGFEIRDSIAWIRTGHSMPKSLDVSKAIDKAAGAERPVIDYQSAPDAAKARPAFAAMSSPTGKTIRKLVANTGPATELAQKWQGWGTALKPASEPIVVARKPLAGTVAANVLAHGAGAINVDGCRVPHATEDDFSRHATSVARMKAKGGRASTSWKCTSDLAGANDVSRAGRWPPNAVFSHLDGCGEGSCAEGCAVSDLEETSAGASRFFPAFRYQAKPSRGERNEGLDDRGNVHATIKPVDLMRWLVRLVTPPAGLVLDPFTGSGTTGVAAVLERARFVGVELLEEHAAIARARIEHAESRFGLAKTSPASTVKTTSASLVAQQLSLF